MPKNITGSYASHSKEELQKEYALRGLKGLEENATKGDIISALQENDEATVEQPKAPLPPLKASPIPQIQPVEEIVERAEGQPPNDHEYTDGIYTDGVEDFALAIVESERNDKTHFLKNSLHFWNGSETEFKLKFTKK